MPYIEVKVIEGVFDATQREQIIERITDAMVSVEGEALRPFTYVVVDEVKGGSWGVGGKALHAADVLGMAAMAGAP
ncbi:MAG TPA: tautomerase family protein [Mycobacteriales bacterium]|nr:tautomerase family protein [Mycobacteriales bacterium]